MEIQLPEYQFLVYVQGLHNVNYPHMTFRRQGIVAHHAKLYPEYIFVLSRFYTFIICNCSGVIPTVMSFPHMLSFPRRRESMLYSLNNLFGKFLCPNYFFIANTQSQITGSVTIDDSIFYSLFNSSCFLMHGK